MADSLEAQRANLPAWVAKTAEASTWLVSHSLTADPAPYLANLELFVPALDDIMRDEVLEKLEDGMPLELTAFLGAYLIQRFGGAWILDDLPPSPSYGRYVIEIVFGLQHLRCDVAAKIEQYLTSPPPRSLAEHLRPVLEAAVAGERSTEP